MRKEELKQFNMESLNGLRKSIENRYGAKHPDSKLLDELEIILKAETKGGEWKQKPKDGKTVLGDVWECPIGEVNYKHRVHKFTYLYVKYNDNQRVAIAPHKHYEDCNNGKQKRKVKEWYFFPDGRIEFCNKDESHQLVNNYREPIYVLSVKAMNNGNH